MKFLILISIIGVCLSITSVKYKKTTTTTTIKKKVTTSSAKLSECYLGHSTTSCDTNCAYGEKFEDGRNVRSVYCNSAKECFGSYLVVALDFYLKFGCCKTNLCNSIPYVNKTLNYDCLPIKNIKNKKLIYPVFNSRLPSVKKCYSCEKCTSPETEITIIDCPKTAKNVCFHFYENVDKTTRYWYAGCHQHVNATYMFSFENNYKRGVICQTDLCNSIKNMQVLENATLCTDGFYV